MLFLEHCNIEDKKIIQKNVLNLVQTLDKRKPTVII
nr:MAG TPA: hypothetical protein [Caudoviricetes sp.]